MTPTLRVAAAALVVALGVARAVSGYGWGVLPLLAVGPALAAVVGGVAFVLVVGAEALVVCGIFLAALTPGSNAYHHVVVTVLAVGGVTAGGALATMFRTRRERELAQVRLVAEAAQRVVLRPVPPRAGPLRLAARYVSASQQARVGGDLYDVIRSRERVRLVVGDAQGKGLAAVQLAAAVLGTFRDAAYEEESLAEVASRMDVSLARQFGPEEFVTAILAEVTPGAYEMTLLSCGHPPPLLLRPPLRPLVGPAQDSLPLGLGHLTGEPRSTVSIPFAPGDKVLFYTDGISEARNSTGGFFPLLGSSALRSPQVPDSLIDQLASEVVTFAGHAPDDDVALLLVHRDAH